jgi:hypothetical protein
MLISLIIPTRERASFLEECLRTAVGIPDDRIEIIVSDNASTDGTRAVVEAVPDRRVRYLNTGRRVAMRQNFEFALEHAQGDYVCFIGDDDGFLTGQFAALRAVLEARRPEVLSWRPLMYGWPIPGFGRRVGGIRFHAERMYEPVHEVDLRPARERLLRADLAALGPCPSIYHGCASRAYLDHMRGFGGQAFGARSPDVYLSYFTILTRDAFLYTHHPFSVNGYSPVSTGNAHHAYRSGDARSKPATQFGAEGATDPVQDAIPEYALSLALNLFGTYETVRRNLPAPPEDDRVAWFRYVLAQTDRADHEAWSATGTILDAHAARTGTADALAAARRAGAGAPSTAKATNALRKLVGNVTSIKCSAAMGGRNTVHTAALMADAVLGDAFVRSSASTRRLPGTWPAAWARAARRNLMRPRA